MLTAIIAVLLTALLVLYLPVWASVSIALVAFLSVVIGGKALLAKVAITAAAVGLAIWLWRRRARRAERRTAGAAQLVAIAEPAVKEPQAAPRRAERQAA